MANVNAMRKVFDLVLGRLAESDKSVSIERLSQMRREFEEAAEETDELLAIADRLHSQADRFRKIASDFAARQNYQSALEYDYRAKELDDIACAFRRATDPKQSELFQIDERGEWSIVINGGHFTGVLNCDSRRRE